MIKAYDIPRGKRIAEGIAMYVNDERVGVFATEVNNTHEWRQDFGWTLSLAAVGIFDFEGKAQIRIRTTFETKSVTVRPLSKNIVPQLTQKEDGTTEITFELSGDEDSFGQYTLEFNDDRNNAMHIFAGHIEEEPNQADIVVKNGTAIYDDVKLKDGQTLYIEGGAAVYGRVIFANNTKVCGRGIIDGSHRANWAWDVKKAFFPMAIEECNNVSVEGISVLNPPCWVFQIKNSENVKLSNIKIVSNKANSDGISIQSSRFVTIEDSFVRTWDDSIVIKATIKNADSHDIYVNNCQIWTDLAQCMELGFETNKGMSDNPRMYNIEFKNITVLHQLHKAAISIHNADDTEIFDVIWENITIEEVDAPDDKDGWNVWLDFTNVPASDFKIPGSTPTWTTVQKRGTIHDITIKNVKVLKDISGSSYRIWPVKEGEDIYNLKFENAYNFGMVEPYDVKK